MKDLVGHYALLSPLLLLLQLLCLRSGSGTADKLRKPSQFISIRGNVGTPGTMQKLPITHTKSWSCWTFEDNVRLEKVEDESDNEDSNVDDVDNKIGWVNPTSYDNMFLPTDLPLPRVDPAVGLLYMNGSPRYAMPSLICTLETPAKKWRNRGICSVPRANGWVDLYGEYTR